MTKTPKLTSAKKDFRFLLDRGYRRKIALKFVGDHYLLDKSQRNFLQRTVFSQEQAKLRKCKLVKSKDLKDRDVLVDGYNVLITVESILQGKDSVVKAEDGLLRDLNAVFGNFHLSKVSYKAISLIISEIKNLKPKSLNFYYDRPVSHSGKLASFTRNCLKKYNLKGEVLVSSHVDQELIKNLDKNKILATSDGILIEKAYKVYDLPAFINKKLKEGSI